MEELIVLESAVKHGVSEESMRHALTYTTRPPILQDDGMIIYIGPDFDGTLIEVGLREWHGIAAITHAMRPARPKYLR